jgi:hypothetical protein
VELITVCRVLFGVRNDNQADPHRDATTGFYVALFKRSAPPASLPPVGPNVMGAAAAAGPVDAGTTSSTSSAASDAVVSSASADGTPGGASAAPTTAVDAVAATPGQASSGSNKKKKKKKKSKNATKNKNKNRKKRKLGDSPHDDESVANASAAGETDAVESDSE